MTTIDPASCSGTELYRLMISLVVPRPIAWVGSRSAEGIDNLAPFSYFTGVSANPMRLAISVARTGGGSVLKDTARNILDTGEFTISLVHAGVRSQMVHSSGAFPSDVDEFDATGLTKVAAERVAACYPGEAKVSFECVLDHQHDFGNTHLLVGRVVNLHVADGVLQVDDAGRRIADLRALDPVSRLGGQDYAHVGETFTIPRPTTTSS